MSNFVTEFTFSGIRSAALAAGIACAALPASAQTIGYGDAMVMLTEACGADVQAHCADVRIGGDRIQACLQQNAGQLSQQCISTYNAVFVQLQTRAAAQQNAHEICESDVRRLCSDFREGRGRILRCLLREDNVRRVSGDCNQAITDAGWR
jgi:hypothetical protein